MVKRVFVEFSAVLTIRATAGRDNTPTRRAFLRAGALGALGLSLPSLLAARERHPNTTLPHFGRAKRCVLLFLTGGPPQHDTWDLKPDAPANIRGELKPIATTVPDLRVSELFPRLARQAHRYCIVRSVSHADTVHTSAGYTMLTGVTHPKANGKTAALIRPLPDDHPHPGALLALARARQGGLPFVCLPEVIKDAGVNEFPGQNQGFLPRQFAPLRVEANPERTGFLPPDVVLPGDVTADRLQQRRFLRERVEQSLTAFNPAGGVDGYYQRAFDVLASTAGRTAFALDREPDRVRDEYGRHLFGQGCLLARRLLEAGVGLVTVYWHYEGPDDSPVWDTHQNNYPHLRQRLMPPTDQALATLLDDLATRGLLDETLIVCMGEFGRSPRINGKGGRDHWPHVQSVMLAGAGVPGGSVFGASDRLGAYPAERPVTPADLTATVLHLLGVPPDLELHDRTGRPLPACTGKPIRFI
jgi:hypothetical protein